MVLKAFAMFSYLGLHLETFDAFGFLQNTMDPSSHYAYVLQA
jgi:hypothetical protein